MMKKKKTFKIQNCKAKLYLASFAGPIFILKFRPRNFNIKIGPGNEVKLYLDMNSNINALAYYSKTVLTQAGTGDSVRHVQMNCELL